MEPIILASSSPRRQDILKMLNIPFRVIMPNIDESFTVGIDASETAELLAREKIIAVQRSLPSEQEIPWILSADTIVYQNGKIYGKPEDQDKAYEEAVQEFKDYLDELHAFDSSKLDKRQKTAYKKIDEFLSYYYEYYKIKDVDYQQIVYVDQFGGYVPKSAT